MPRTEVILFRSRDGGVPFLEWFRRLEKKVRIKCFVAIEQLEESGHELRPPWTKYLERKIHELRVRHRHVNYRMLYFFHERTCVVISHGFTKERFVPPREIDAAVSRREQYERDPETHSGSFGQQESRQ